MEGKKKGAGDKSFGSFEIEDHFDPTNRTSLQLSLGTSTHLFKVCRETVCSERIFEKEWRKT